ncbi:MAG: NAD-binding protein [Candidatus Heimdallarchaeota archaeon]
MVSKGAHYIIIGYGRVGSKLASILLERGARVSVLDPFEEADLEHPDFRFYRLDATEMENLEKAGFPKDVAGVIIVAGSFSVNASVFFSIESYAAREDKPNGQSVLVVRARNAEEKEIFMQNAAKSAEEIYVIYSEETGAHAVAAEMGVLLKQKQNLQLKELTLQFNGTDSLHLTKLLEFFETYHIEVLNEFCDFHSGVAEYRAILGELPERVQNKLEDLLSNISSDYSLVELLPEQAEQAAEKVMAYSI